MNYMNQADKITNVGKQSDATIAGTATNAAHRPSPSAVWNRPAALYPFAIAVAMILLTPFPTAWLWIRETFSPLWKDSEVVFPVFVIVFVYTSYCCIRLFQGELGPAQTDRLQLAEYLGYFAGMLGVVLRLVSLSHGKSDTLDSKSVLGALAPFEIGLLVWGFALTVRWVAEHRAHIESTNSPDEN
jgi:hypothetical protein